jgi:ABC-type phosphate/phosphonate transport system substrate-binding protein
MRRFVVLAAIAVLTPSLLKADDSVRVGIPRSIFRDVPSGLLAFANQPFKDLMKAQTGIEGDVINDEEALNIARDINDGKVQLGVFLGHEFAWAKEKYPGLEPLVCAVPKPREVQAFIIVRYDCKAACMAETKGMRLVTASGLRDCARIYLEKRQSEDMGSTPFSSVGKTSTVHESLHKVIDGEADVTVTDGASWSYFQKLYPGASQNLKVLSKSDVFPATVIAYKKGTITDDKVQKLRTGLLSAHTSTKGAHIMRTIKIEKFDNLPSNYSGNLKECLKAYPIPSTDHASADK